MENLHGDIVATASEAESATALASTIAEPTEFGVPGSENPPKYSWLGAGEVPTELASGVTAMGVRSYVPQIGRFLQPDPTPGGSANAYAYTYGNPINETDLSGAESSGGMSALGEGEGEDLAGGVGYGEGAIMPPPVNTEIEAAFEAAPPWSQSTAGDDEYEEYEEEEEGEEGEEDVMWEEPASGEPTSNSGVFMRGPGGAANRLISDPESEVCTASTEEFAMRPINAEQCPKPGVERKKCVAAKAKHRLVLDGRLRNQVRERKARENRSRVGRPGAKTPKEATIRTNRPTTNANLASQMRICVHR